MRTVCGLLVVAVVALITVIATAPTPASPAPVPVSACERALSQKLATTEYAVRWALVGQVSLARDLYYGASTALPEGCGS